MPDIELAAPASRNSSHPQVNSSDLVNFFREPVGQGGIATHILRRAPAPSAFSSLSDLFIRDMREIGGTLYVLNGASLKSVSRLGDPSTLGSIVSAEGGHLFGETGAVGLVSGGEYRLWDGATLSEPVVTPFITTTGNVQSGAFFKGYTILTEKNTRRVAWSAVLDAATFPGLNTAFVDGTEDNILRVIPLNDNLWFFKENSFEIWYLTGQANQNAFAPVPGGVTNTGLKAANLVTVLRDVMMFIGTDGIAYLSDGQSTRPVSNTAVERNIATREAETCFSWEYDGHKFLGIGYRNHPSDILDVATGEWWRRSGGQPGDAWNIRACAYFNQQWLAGANDGEIYVLAEGGADATLPRCGECGA